MLGTVCTSDFKAHVDIWVDVDIVFSALDDIRVAGLKEIISRHYGIQREKAEVRIREIKYVRKE